MLKQPTNANGLPRLSTSCNLRARHGRALLRPKPGKKFGNYRWIAEAGLPRKQAAIAETAHVSTRAAELLQPRGVRTVAASAGDAGTASEGDLTYADQAGPGVTLLASTRDPVDSIPLAPA